MPKVIQVPGTGLVQFPDEMTDSQIEAAIKSNFDGSVRQDSSPAPTVQAPAPTIPENVSPEKAALLEQQQQLNAEPYNPNLTGGEQLAADVWRGFKNLQQMGYGLGALGADLVGADQTAQNLLQGYQRVGEEAALLPGKVGSFKNIHNWGDLGQYATEKFAENVAMFLPSLASGGVGAIVAKKAGEKAAVKLVEELVAKGVARQVAEKTAAETLAKQMTTGGLLGALPSSVGMEAGSIYGDIDEKTGQRAPWTALAAGTVAGALDVLPEVRLLGRVLGPTAAKEVAEGLVKRVGKAAAEQILSEGLTEGAQTVIERAAVQAVDKNQGTFSKDGITEIIDSMLAGSIAGGVMGAGGGAIESYRMRGQPKPDTPEVAAAKATLDTQRAAEQAPTTEMFQAPQMSHANDVVGRTLNSDGVPIGVIIRADPQGFLVDMGNGRNPTLVPYGSLNLRPGINIRAPFEYDSLVGRWFDNGAGRTAKIIDANDVGITIESHDGQKSKDTYANLNSTPLDVYNRTFPAGTLPKVEPAPAPTPAPANIAPVAPPEPPPVQPTPPVQPAVKPAEPVNPTVTPVTQPEPTVTPPPAPGAYETTPLTDAVSKAFPDATFEQVKLGIRAVNEANYTAFSNYAEAVQKTYLKLATDAKVPDYGEFAAFYASKRLYELVTGKDFAPEPVKEPNAPPKQETSPLDVRQPPGNGPTVGQGNAEHETPAGTGGKVPKPEAPQRSPAGPATVKDRVHRLLMAEPGEMSSAAKAREIKKLADEQGITVKEMQEVIESRLVRLADEIVRSPDYTPEQKFRSLVGLYNRQPVFSARTSTSVENQAYSTPAPLAFALSWMTGVTGEKGIYEPTAGNGMLMIGGNLKGSHANELNEQRRNNLGTLGLGVGTVSGADATTYWPGKAKYPVVHTNPPFGSIDNVNYNGFGIKKLEHLISLKALEAMADNGTAGLILGATREQSDQVKGAQWVFENYLYGHYNVVANFEVSGDLYGRQGAKWPVRVLIISGRKANPVTGEFAPKRVDRLNTWDDVWKQAQATRDEIERQRQTVVPPGQPGVPVRPGQPAAPANQPGTVPAPPSRTPNTSGARRGPRRTGPSQPNVGGGSPGGGAGVSPQPPTPRPQNPTPANVQSNGGGQPPTRVEGGNGRSSETPGSAPGTVPTTGGATQPGSVPKPTSLNRPASDLTGLTDSDLDALLDEAVGATKPAPPSAPPQAPKPEPAPAPTPPAENASQAAVLKSAAQFGINAADEAVKGLFNLFGGGKNLGTGVPSFDNETYQKAKPHFQAAYNEAVKAGKSLADFFKWAFNTFGEGIRPYLKRFVQDLQAAATKVTKKIKETAFQTIYQPRSQGTPFETLTPNNIASGEHAALDALKEKVGPIDDFVADRLNMTPDEVRSVMSAEQIDGVALAIHQIETGGALIIGDETGIGKGRQAAAVIRYAVLKGKVPMFFTKDPKLFSDMFGDLTDIHTTVKPFILGESEKASIKDTNGNVLVQAPSLARQKREIDEILSKGLVESGYNAIFSTYYQVNMRNNRQEFLEKLARDKDTIVILDEAHEAAGDSESSMQAAFISGGRVKRGSGANIDFITVPGLLRQPGTQAGRGGVVYLSATYAKRSENMPVYFRTSLHLAAQNFGQIVDSMKRGGVALQQAVSEALAKAGQYVRRERDFTGVSYNMEHIKVADENALKEEIDGVTDVLAQIVDFSQRLRDAVKTAGQRSTAMTQSQIDVTDFAAIVHNQVGQLLLAAKADAVVEKAKQAKAKGEKPLIALMNTMESFLDHYTEDHGIKSGDPIKLRWNELLSYALSRTLRTTETLPNGDTVIGTANPEEFGLGDLYRQIQEAAEAVESKYPVSPIDYIIQKLKAEGVNVVELTGRESGIEYTDFEAGHGIYRRFPKANKNDVVNGFNNGTYDGMLLNASGSTGLSAHASVKVKDQRPRHMLIAQPALDINVFVQTLGRIKRTGMVLLGMDESNQPYGAKYSHLVLPLQAELRPAAMAARKMKSLNANTTAEAEGAVKIESEDLFNRYGDQIVAEYLDQSPELQARLGLSIGVRSDGSPDVPRDIARKFTGRMALMPDDEQKAAYEAIIPAYRELIAQLKATNEYDLEIAVHDDWDGVKVSDTELSAGTDPSNIFTAGVQMQEWEIKDNRHVPTGEEMLREFERKTGGKDATGDTWVKHQDTVDRYFTERIAELERIESEAPNAIAQSQYAAVVANTRMAQQRWTDDVRPELDSVFRDAGDVVELTNTETNETFRGILASFKLPNKRAAAPSGFRFRFMIDAPGGVLYLTGSDITSHKWTISLSSDTPADLKGAKGGSRYTRYFLTGNPIQGYVSSGGRGKIVRFKAREGNIVTGLLMPNNWQPNQLASDPRLDLVSGRAVQNFLTQFGIQGYRTQVPVESSGLVRIVRQDAWSRDYTISTSAARSTGGKIFLDPALRRITGDFTKTGSRMVATISEDRLARAADRIMQITGTRFRPQGNAADLVSQVRQSNGGSGGINPSGGQPSWTDVEGSTDQVYMTPDAVREAVANELKLPGVEFRIVDEPGYRDVAGLFGYRDGKPIVWLNSAGLTDADAARQTLREEYGHSLLSSPDGARFIRDFAENRMTDAEREELNRGLYAQREGESDADYRMRMANEFIAKAGRKKLGLWRELVERVKVWFASKGLGTLTNEEAARAILRKLAKDAKEGRLSPGSLPEDAPNYALNPISSPAEFRKAMSSAEEMQQADALFNAKVFHVENATTAGLARDEFLKLPKDVQDSLSMIQGRIQAMAEAEAAANKFGGSAPSVSGSLRDVVEQLSPERHEQAQAVLGSFVNMLDLLDAANKYDAKFFELVGEYRKKRQQDLRRIPAERAASAANSFINYRRGVLTERRATATDPTPFNDELAFWDNRKTAVANVLRAIAESVPVDVLRKPDDPKAIVAAIPAGVDFHANNETVEAVKKAMSEMPSVNLIGIREPGKSPELLALVKKLKTMAQGRKFLYELRNSDQFKENYEQAVDLTGARGLVAKTSDDGNLVYENPYDHTKSVTIAKGFDQRTYENNVKALEQAKEWFQAYIDDPKADPLKKAGIEQQLWAIDHVHLSQQFDPKTGKLLAGGFNPFHLLMRAFGSAVDIPEYQAQLAGGREASSAMRDTQNYANARQAVVQSHLKERLKASVTTRNGARARKMDIATYQEEILNELLGSYQNRGDVKLHVGAMVRGHTLTALDLEAATAQKAYFDALNRSVRALEQTTVQGKANPVRTRDVVGDLFFERDPHGTSELMVPQRLKGNAIPFVRKWTEIRDNSSLSKAQKAQQFQELLDGEFLHDGLVGHIESFRNPSYAAEIGSQFKSDYLDLHREHDQTGKTVDSLDDLVQRLFDGQQSLPAEDQLSEDQIREAVLKEIGKAVSAFEADESKSDELANPDKSHVRVISAENFMNRPRGRRLLPKGFYTYTVGTDAEQSGVQFHILQVFGQRLVNSLAALRESLSRQVGEFKTQVKEGKTEKEIKENQKLGENFLSLADADQAQKFVNRALNDFTTFMTQKQGQELAIYQWLNMSRSVMANAILQRFPTMLGNWLGAPFQRTMLDMAVLNTGKGLLMRFWPVGGTYATLKNITLHGKATVDAALGMILNQPEVTPRAKALHDYLKRNHDFFSKFAGYVSDYLMRQQARVQYLKEVGAMEEDPWRHNLEAVFKFGTEGGKLTDQPRSFRRKAADLVQTAIHLFNETGGLLQLPRAMGVGLVDTINNSISDGVATSLVNNLVLSSERAFRTRAAAGYDPVKTILTPEEVFGRKGASGRDLAELRSFFDRAGLNLDRILIEYWQQKQSGNPVDAISDVLGTEGFNSLVLEISKWLNKGTFANRAFYNSSLARAAGLFMGYGLNQNAQLARLFSKYSRDAANPLWQNGELFLRAAMFVFLVALFGNLYQPAVGWLKSFFYKEENPIKPIWKSNTVGEAARIQLQNSAFILPLVGRVLMNTVGAAAPGMAGSAFGIQLFPASAAKNIIDAVSRFVQTGDFTRSFVDVMRQFIPNSRVILNRTEYREGTLNESNLRASLVSNAPPGVDVKPYLGPQGTQILSPARPYVDRVTNALSKNDGPDMVTVAEARAQGIAALVKAGKDPEDAAKSFDRSIISRNPFMSAFGRNLTETEMFQLRQSMSPEQRANLDRFVRGRQAYAQAYGLSEPDYIRGNDTSGAPPTPAQQVHQATRPMLPPGMSGVRRTGMGSVSTSTRMPSAAYGMAVGASERSGGMPTAPNTRTNAAATPTAPGLSGLSNTGTGSGASLGRIRGARRIRTGRTGRIRGIRRSSGRLSRGSRKLSGVRRGFGKLRARRKG